MHELIPHIRFEPNIISGKCEYACWVLQSEFDFELYRLGVVSIHLNIFEMESNSVRRKSEFQVYAPLIRVTISVVSRLRFGVARMRLSCVAMRSWRSAS